MMKKVKQILNNQKGLTLVELLAVIVILGIISAIAVPSIAGIIDNTKKDAHVANAQQMISAAKLAVAANDKETLGDLKGTTTEYYDVTLAKLMKYGYLDDGFIDPDTNEEYVNLTTSKVLVVVTPATTTKGKQYQYRVKLFGTDKKIANGDNGITSAVLSTALDRSVVKEN